MKGREGTYPVVNQGKAQLLFVEERAEYGPPVEVEGIRRPVDVRMCEGRVVGEVPDLDDVRGISPGLVTGRSVLEVGRCGDRGFF